MIQLNLLPDVKKEFLKAQRTKAMVISISILIVLISAGLTILFAVIIYVVQPGVIALQQGGIDDKTVELKSVEDISKYLTLQNQLESLPQLHSQTVEYSRVFDFMKILNPAPPNDITLNSLQVNNLEENMTMEGTASGFEAFSVFKDTLDNAKVSYTEAGGEKQTIDLFLEGGVVVNDQSLSNNDGDEILSFSVLATYNPAVFDPTINEIKLTIPNIQTSQAISNPPNREVFNEEEGN